VTYYLFARLLILSLKNLYSLPNIRLNPTAPRQAQGIGDGEDIDDFLQHRSTHGGDIAKWVYFDHVLSVPFGYKSLSGREIGRKNP
jgi:hypothetical protein